MLPGTSGVWQSPSGRLEGPRHDGRSPPVSPLAVNRSGLYPSPAQSLADLSPPTSLLGRSASRTPRFSRTGHAATPMSSLRGDSLVPGAWGVAELEASIPPAQAPAHSRASLINMVAQAAIDSLDRVSTERASLLRYSKELEGRVEELQKRVAASRIALVLRGALHSRLRRTLTAWHNTAGSSKASSPPAPAVASASSSKGVLFSRGEVESSSKGVFSRGEVEALRAEVVALRADLGACLGALEERDAQLAAAAAACEGAEAALASLRQVAAEELEDMQRGADAAAAARLTARFAVQVAELQAQHAAEAARIREHAAVAALQAAQEHEVLVQALREAAAHADAAKAMQRAVAPADAPAEPSNALHLEAKCECLEATCERLEAEFERRCADFDAATQGLEERLTVAQREGDRLLERQQRLEAQLALQAEVHARAMEDVRSEAERHLAAVVADKDAQVRAALAIAAAADARASIRVGTDPSTSTGTTDALVAPQRRTPEGGSLEVQPLCPVPPLPLPYPSDSGVSAIALAPPLAADAAREARLRAAARARLRRLMKSGGLRKALLALAAAEDGDDVEQGLDFGASAELVTGFVALDSARGPDGAAGRGSALQSLFSIFSSAPAGSKDDAKSVEKQAEMTNAGNDNVWAAVRAADWEKLERLLDADPQAVKSRGAVGETLLHLCYLLHSPERTDIAHKLLARAPALVRTVYEGAVYRGENALHMAIANSDLPEARFLFRRCRGLLYGLADGLFFSKNGFGQEGNAYYGELPLSFAVCTNQPDMVRFLVEECGAVISAGDSHGNTAAHMCVFHDRLDMYDLLDELWERGYGRPLSQASVPLSAVHNMDGYTPLVLAAALGKTSAFCRLWDRTRETQWSWGSISCHVFPLHFVDDGAQVLARLARAQSAVSTDQDAASSDSHALIFSDAAAAVETSTLLASLGRGSAKATPPSTPPPRLLRHLPTALEVAVSCGHLEILTIPRVQQLLDKKWTRFAYRMFLSSMLSTAAYLAVFAATGILRSNLLIPPEEEEGATVDARRLFRPMSECPQDLFATCLFASIGEGLVILGAVYKLYAIGMRVTNVGWTRFLDAGLMDCVLSTACCAMALGSFVVDWVFGQEFGALPLALASLVMWAHLGWYLLGFKTTGPFIIMIAHMITIDLVQFASLALIFILGATQAFFLLQDKRGIGGFLDQMHSLFITMISGDHPEVDDGSVVQLSLSTAYVVIACILLVNLLVALFGATFSKISEAADLQYHLERARIILSFEQAMSDRLRASDTTKYWTLVNGSPYLLAEEKDDMVFANDGRVSEVKGAVEVAKEMPARTVQSARA